MSTPAVENAGNSTEYRTQYSHSPHYRRHSTIKMQTTIQKKNTVQMPTTIKKTHYNITILVQVTIQKKKYITDACYNVEKLTYYKFRPQYRRHNTIKVQVTVQKKNTMQI